MAEETGNKRKTARRFRVDPAQIRIWSKEANWRREQYNLLESGKKLPSPKWKDVLNWLKEIWDTILVEIVKNSFTGSGYYFEDEKTEVQKWNLSLTMMSNLIRGRLY